MEILTIHMLFTALFWSIVFDFITGTFREWKKGKVTSKECGDGLTRTMGECIYLLILLLFNNIFPHTNILIAFLVLAFLFKEGISIIENLHQLGVWIPKWVKKGLEVCVEKIDSIDVEKLDSMEDKK